MSQNNEVSNSEKDKVPEGGPTSQNEEALDKQSEEHTEQSVPKSEKGQPVHRKPADESETEALVPTSEFTDSLQASAPTMDVDTRRQLDQIYYQIERIRDNKTLGVRARRELLANQVKTIIELEKTRVEAQKEGATMAIFMQLDEFQLRLRERYQEMFKALGARVEIQKLDFLFEFGKELTKHYKKFKEADLLPSMQESLLKEAKQAFINVKNKIAQMTADIIESSSYKRLKP